MKKLYAPILLSGLLLSGCAYESEVATKPELITFLYKDSRSVAMPDVAYPCYAVHEDRYMARVVRVFNDPRNDNIIHVVTEVWEPNQTKQGDKANLGYAKLEKLDNGYRVLTPQMQFAKAGKWGRLLEEDVDLVQIGEDKYGLLVTGKELEKDLERYFNNLYEIVDYGTPRKLLSFYVNAEELLDTKISLVPSSKNKLGYYDYVLEGTNRKGDPAKITFIYKHGKYTPKTKIATLYIKP